MEYYDFQQVIIEDRRDFVLKSVEKFLNNYELDLDKDLDYTLVLYDNDNIIATGSFKENILKCIAVSEDYKGFGISNKIISSLISEQYRRGYTHIFIYTKPKNAMIFKDLGFYEIEEVKDKVLLLENKQHGIEDYCKYLIKESPKMEKKNIAAVVVNANPFTLGHRYLIEKASKENDLVHVFVLWEDKSCFSNVDRYNMVKEGTLDLENVVLHKAKDYIISSATFPAYFIRQKNEVLKIQCILDSKIFSKHIATSLNITKRYVGEEPFSESTKEYNEVMKNILKEYGLTLIEVRRKEFENTAISASRVREFFKKGELDKLKNLVPKTTYEYLLNKID